MDDYSDRCFSSSLLKEVILTPPCASLVMHLAVIIPSPSPEDGFLEKDKGYVLRISLCESAAFSSPLLTIVLACFSLPVLSAVSRRKRLFSWQLSNLYSLIAQLQPGNAPAQQQLCHCLTSLQPTPVNTVVAHLLLQP